MRFAIALLLGAGTAGADTPRDTPAAIEVDRDDTAPGRPELGFDGGAPLASWAAEVSFGWLERPVKFGDTEAVRRRQAVALGGAIAAGSFVFDARLRGSHQVGARLAAFDDTRSLDRFVLGDLRLGARISVIDGVFVRADLTLPTGDDGDLAGEPSWSATWRLIGRLPISDVLTLAGSAGIRLRGIEVAVGDRIVGDELVGAFGTVVTITPELAASAELAGALGDDVGVARGPSPVEARLGFVARPRVDLAIGVRVGTGLDDQIGAPRVRAMLDLVYAAP